MPLPAASVGALGGFSHGDDLSPPVGDGCTVVWIERAQMHSQGNIWHPHAHPSPFCCFLQVQERCDYDLVMPLALLFYYAVLYVSQLHTALPNPL